MAATETGQEKLELLLTPSARRKLQFAALAVHRSVSEFVLENALARADEILPDRQQSGLDARQWVELQPALNAPPRAMPRLQTLLSEPGVFARNEAVGFYTLTRPH